MKRSLNISLGLLASVAAITMSGCASHHAQTVEQHCVDANGNVIPEVDCERPGVSAYRYPHYVYGGTVTDRYGRTLTGYGATRPGGMVRGYSTSMPGSSATIVSPSGHVVRGGFGGSASEGEGGRGGRGGAGRGGGAGE